MDIKGLVRAILEFKRNKDTSQLQLIEIYKKQIKNDVIAAFEMSQSLIQENITLFSNSPSFLTFLFQLINVDDLSFKATKSPLKNSDERVKETNESILDQLQNECKDLKKKNAELLQNIEQINNANNSVTNKIHEELEALNKQISLLKEKNSNIEKERNQLNQKVLSLEKDKAGLNDEIHELKSKLQKCLQEKKSEEDHNETLQNKLLEHSELSSFQYRTKAEFEKVQSLLQILYNFLLEFNGDIPALNADTNEYLQSKLENTLKKIHNDYELLKQWALLNFNIQTHSFNVASLVSKFNLRQPKITEIENVCPKNLIHITEQQVADLNTELNDKKFMQETLKRYFGADLFKDSDTFFQKLSQTVLESDIFKQIKQNLTEVFGNDVDEENILEKIRKVVRFVLQVLHFMSTDNSNFLPESIRSLRHEIISPTSSAIEFPEKNMTLPIDSIEKTEREQNLEQNLHSYETQLKNCLTDLDQCKNRLNESHKELKAWENTFNSRNQTLENDMYMLKKNNETRVNELSDKILQLQEENSQLKLQLETCLNGNRNEKNKNRELEKQLQDQLSKLKETASQEKKLQDTEKENKHLKETIQNLTKDWEATLEENQKLMLSTLKENQNYIDKIKFFEEEIKMLKEQIHIYKIAKTYLPKKYTTPQEEFESENDSRKRKAKSQDIYKSFDSHIDSERDLQISEKQPSFLSQCILQKDKLMTELQECKDKLQKYDTLFKDASYISSAHNQDVNSFKMTNLKKLFIAFFTYHFQKRVLSKDIPQDEDNLKTLLRLKELLEELEKSDKNNYNSIIYMYVFNEISTLTEIKTSVNYENIASINELLLAAINNVKMYIKTHPSEKSLKKMVKKKLYIFDFGNEDIIDTIQKMLNYLRNICNSSIVTNMVEFLNELDTVSTKRLEQLPDNEKIRKSSLIVKCMLS